MAKRTKILNGTCTMPLVYCCKMANGPRDAHRLSLVNRIDCKSPEATRMIFISMHRMQLCLQPDRRLVEVQLFPIRLPMESGVEPQEHKTSAEEPPPLSLP